MASRHEIREEHVRPFQVSDSESRRTEIAFSILACLFALLAFPAQICLTVIDKHADPSLHRTLLFLALAGTGLSAICTGVAIWLSSPMVPSSKNRRDNMIYRYRYRHFILLIALSILILVWNIIKILEPPISLLIRLNSRIINTTLLPLEIIIGIAFTVLLWKGFFRTSGILEWTMSLLFTFYFWTLAGLIIM